MNVQLKLLSTAICRIPAFPSETELHLVWDDLKNMIEDASPAFYEIIKDCQASAIMSLDEKIRFTLFKYYNRSQNRATPFGKFGSITVIPMLNQSKVQPSIIVTKPRYHEFNDWSLKNDFEQNLTLLKPNGSLIQANATVYLSGSKIKYLYFADGVFELSSIDYDESIYKALIFARKTRTGAELVNFLAEERSINKHLSFKLLTQLIDLKLLLSDIQPNIIGEDYFQRNGITGFISKKRYIIAERTLQSGDLLSSSFKELMEATILLNQILPSPGDNDLDSFKRKFIEKFSQSEMQLSFVLDPETGIGYGDLESEPNTDSLINAIKESSFQLGVKERKLSYGSLHEFLLSSLINGNTIQLEDFSIKNCGSTVPSLPNTLNAIVKISEGAIICERIGGSTANSLLGRFSMAGRVFEKLGQTISDIEERSNPDVLFFDIGYLGEEKVDNVNRRQRLYSYEFPILSYSTNDKQVRFDDLLVSVRNGEVVVRSKELGKRVIPKIASAYNYTRSDLALFRFLADLQNQNIRTSMTFDFLGLIPGLPYYPRVQFKKVILSLAKWLLPKAFTIAGKQGADSVISDLKVWLAERKLQKFICGHADQKLVINSNNDAELNFFLMFAKNKEPLYIEEYVEPKQDLIFDGENKHYNSEFVLNFYHEDPIYKPLTDAPTLLLPKGDNLFLLGGEWLYFEIYSHYTTRNYILTEYIQEYLSKHKDKVRCWFFILYDTPASHIRFRLKLKNMSDGYFMMNEMSAVLKPLILEGIISDYQLKPYIRESERYGNKNIETVEQFFWFDSTLIMELLSKAYTTSDLYLISIELIESILDYLSYDFDKKNNFYAEMMNGLATKLTIAPTAFKRINEEHKQFKSFSAKRRRPSNTTNLKLKKTKVAFIESLTAIEEKDKEKMVADLFHMHVNRLFSNDQLFHEMILYNFLNLRFKANYFSNIKMPSSD
ncbi:MAG: thiopeptide-type bacteriocin biosynthesis protein [Bacteroidetes bacterium]|jgi:thiopeptide-type bacteriocin biosynthesis protein|nr:thiopeptide-type bacteriocin biosynthesis protein [Bacteroidota bacterium]